MRLIGALMLAAMMLAFSSTGHAAESPAAATAPPGGTHQGRDVAVTWTIQRTTSSVTVQGQLKNIFYYVLSDVEIRGTLYDANGKKVGKEAVFFVPGQLNRDESTGFSLALQVPPSVVPKNIKVMYTYRELDKDYSASPYFYTFDIPL